MFLVEVSCGSHKARSCAGCPQENGASWCNGDCKWCLGNCQMKNDQCVFLEEGKPTNIDSFCVYKKMVHTGAMGIANGAMGIAIAPGCTIFLWAACTGTCVVWSTTDFT